MQFTTFALAALSMGSAFAAPSAVARQTPSVLQNAIQAVAEAQTAVQTQVTIIENLVASTINGSVIPAIAASLRNIASEITSVTNVVNLLVAQVIVPLTQAELAAIPGLVASVQNITQAVEDTANLLINRLSTESLRLVRQEIFEVVATIDPFVQPVRVFAYAVLTGITSPMADTVRLALNSINIIIGQLLGPITIALLRIFKA